LNFYGRKKKYAFKYQLWARFPDNRILGIFGPYPSKETDGKIYNATILPYLQPGEKVLADKAYVGCPSALSPIQGTKAGKEKALFSTLCLGASIQRISALPTCSHRTGVSEDEEVQCSHTTLSRNIRSLFAAIGKLINVELELEPLFSGTPSYIIFRGHIFSMKTWKQV
jgi:hypothetical protein